MSRYQHHWRRSGRCGANWHCVELSRVAPRRVGVRDSQDEGTSLVFTSAALSAFVADIKRGTFDHRS
jgi:hypothetical protein